MLPDDRAIGERYLLISENYTPDYWVDDELLRHIFVYICNVYDNYFTLGTKYEFLPASTIKDRIHQYVKIDSNIRGLNKYWDDGIKKTAIVAIIAQLANLPRDTQHNLRDMLHEVFTLKGLASGYSRKESSDTSWIRFDKWYKEYIRFQDAAIEQIKVQNALTQGEHGLDLSF